MARRRHDLPSLVVDFLDDCRARNRSARTVEWYADKFDRFIQWARPQGVRWFEDCDRPIARRFLAEKAQHAGPFTLNGYVESFKRLANWAVREELIDAHPWQRLEKLRTPRDLPRTLTASEVQRFLKACAGRTKLRDRAMALFLYDTGCRVGELRTLTLPNCHFEAGYAKVRGKGNKERLVPLSDVAIRAIKEYTRYERRPKDPDEAYVFLTYDGTPLAAIQWEVAHGFAVIAKRAGLPKANPHMWRHTAATEMIRNGANTAQVQRILGHEHIATTEIYTHLVSEDVLAAHRRVSPASRLMGKGA